MVWPNNSNLHCFTYFIYPLTEETVVNNKYRLHSEVEKSNSFTSDDSDSYLEIKEEIEEDDSTDYVGELTKYNLYYEADLYDIPF